MKKQEFDISVEVCNPMEETCVAMLLIAELLQKNDIGLNIKIAYDYDCDGMGFYLPDSGKLKHTIFINPSSCKTKKNILDGDEICFVGYVADLTVFGVTIHEFCHLLQFVVFSKIVDNYTKQFPTERLYLNSYSNHEIIDELAEIMALYITNPFLLKLISKEHWKFCKNYFKSPVACSTQRAREIYKAFPIVIKEDLKNKWKITYNEHTKKFERLGEWKN